MRHLAVDGLAFRRSEEADHALVVGVVGALGEGGSGEGLPGVLRDGSVDFDILVAEVEAGAFRGDGHYGLGRVDIVVFVKAVALGQSGECEGIVVEFEHLDYVGFREDKFGDVVVGDVEGFEFTHVVEVKSREAIVAHVEIFHIVGILECEFFELVVRQVEVTDYTDKLGDFKFGKGVVMEIDVREIVLAVIAVCTGEAEAAVESVSGDYKFFEASVPLQVDRSRCVDATVHVGTGEAQVAELFERRKVDGVNFHAVEAEGCDVSS